MSRRTVLLVAAILVAALGTTLVFIYVNGLHNQAIADQNPVQVLVAKNQIAQGTTAANAAKAGAFQLRTMPRSAVAPGALSDVTGIANEVALSAIFPGEQILSVRFGAPTALPASTALAIPAGQIAVSVQLGDPQRVAGFVLPGSDVSVFVTLPINGKQTIRLLVPRALVVGVGPTAGTPQVASAANPATANPEPTPRTILTLALSQRDSEKLIFASQQGQLYFGLLTDKSQVAPDPGVSVDNLFS